MRRSIFLIMGAFLVLEGVNGDEAKDKALCIKKSRQMFKKIMKSYSACNKELGMMNKTAVEYKESLGCTIKCVMKKFEVLDKDDLITESMVKEHIEKALPDSHKKHAHEALMKCVKLHDDLKPKDPKCKTYQKLGSCMQDALTDLCGELPMI